MDTSLQERGRTEGGEGGGLTQKEADDGLYLFLLRVAGQPLYSRKGFGIIWCGGRRGVMSPDREPCDWTEEHAVESKMWTTQQLSREKSQIMTSGRSVTGEC